MPLVPEAGFEPARIVQQILSLPCLPFHHSDMVSEVGVEPTCFLAADFKSAVSAIPPLRRGVDRNRFKKNSLYSKLFIPVMARVTRVELVITESKSVALPFG